MEVGLPQCIVLCRQALKMVSRRDRPKTWAQLHATFANDLLQYPVRNERAEDLEEAIEHYNLALEERTRERNAILWDLTTSHLGCAYLNQMRADKRENLERAIVLFRRAQEVVAREAHPIGLPTAATPRF